MVKDPIQAKSSRRKIVPSPHVKTIWRLYSVLLVAPAGLLVLLIGAYWPIAGIVLCAVLLIAYGILWLWGIPLYCRCYEGELTEEFVRLTTGVFLRRTVHIQYDCIQYCVLSQSVLQRFFEVCSVKLMMAGSVSVIRQVSLSDGKQIRAFVEKKIAHEAPAKRGSSHA